MQEMLQPNKYTTLGTRDELLFCDYYMQERIRALVGHETQAASITTHLKKTP